MAKSLWQSFCHAINGPLTTKIYITFLIASFSFIVLTWRDFGQHYQDRLEDLKTARAMNETICHDSKRMVETRMVDECKVQLRILHSWPLVWAFYDVLEDLSLCGRGGCVQLLDDYASLYVVKLTIAFVVFWVIFMFAMGIGTWQNHRQAVLSKHDLPSNGMQVVPFKRYDADEEDFSNHMDVKKNL